MPASRLSLLVPLLVAGACAAPRAAAPRPSAAAPASGEVRLARDVTVRPLAPGLWEHVTLGPGAYPANGVLLETPDGGSVLFDTGWNDAQAEALLRWAADSLRRPVRRVVVTHAHVDRLGGLGAVHARGIPAVALALTAARARGGAQLATNVPAPDSVPGLGAAAVRDAAGYELRFPGAGHAPDNVVVWFPAQRVLFGGCLVKADTATTVGNVDDADVAAWPGAVARVRAAYPDARVVVPGHGATGGVAALVATERLVAERGAETRRAANRARADALAAALDAKAPAWLAEQRVPSIAVAYVRDGAVQWTRVYGEQAPGVPASPRTLYNVASLTKPVFAETILRLAAAGRLSLDEPLDPYWVDPDVAGDARHRALTPRLALSHQTGFANWRRETGGVLRFTFDPGTAYRYSGEGFEYLAAYARTRLHASLDSLARASLFAPLGMRSTAFTRQDWFDGRVAVPMGPQGQWGKPSYATIGNAADDLYTTIGDYGAFLAGVMRRDGLPAALAGQRDSLHVLDTTPGSRCDPARVPRCPTRIGYGLGWGIMEYPDGPVRWHTGSDWGEKAMVFYLPARREGLVMLTNGDRGFPVMIDVALLVVPDTDLAGYLRAGRR